MLSFFPRDVLDEIWDLIGSVSEGFLTYCFREKRSFETQLIQLLMTWVGSLFMISRSISFY